MLVKLYHKRALEGNSVTLSFVLLIPFHSYALQTKLQFCLSSNPPAPGPGDNFLLVSISHRNLIFYWPASEHAPHFGKMRHKENLLGEKRFFCCLLPSFLLWILSCNGVAMWLWTGVGGTETKRIPETLTNTLTLLSLWGNCLISRFLIKWEHKLLCV